MPWLLLALLSGCVLPEAQEWIGEAGGPPATSSGSTGGANAGGGGGASSTGTTTQSSTGVGGVGGQGGATSSAGGGGATSSTGGGGATSSTGGGGATSSAGGGGATSTTGTGGGGPTSWSLVQFEEGVTDSAFLTLPSPTGAGNLIVVAAQSSKMSTVNDITDDVGNDYVVVPNSHSEHGMGFNSQVDIWYAQNSIPGATLLFMNLAGDPRAFMAWEVSGMVTTGSPVDVANALTDEPSSVTPLGAPVTTTVDGAFIVSVALFTNNSPGISSGNEFTTASTLRGNGWAHITSPTAPAGLHQAQWDQPLGGGYGTSTAAFKPGP